MTESENLFSHKEQLTAGFVVGNLEPEEAVEFQELLVANPDLAVEVNHLQNTLDHVLYGLNEVKPPQHLQQIILSAASSTTHQTWTPKHFFPWGKIILGSVVALIILCLGLDNYRLRQDLRLAQDTHTLLEYSNTRLFPLQGVNVAKTASGSFVLNLEQQKGIIALQNLPIPPTGHIYELWVLVDGDKIPCGQINVNSQGRVVEKFSMPADFYDTSISGFFVTLETSTTQRYPAGPTVIKSILR